MSFSLSLFIFSDSYLKELESELVAIDADMFMKHGKKKTNINWQAIYLLVSFFFARAVDPVDVSGGMGVLHGPWGSP